MAKAFHIPTKRFYQRYDTNQAVRANPDWYVFGVNESVPEGSPEYWKMVNGKPVLMSVAERAAVDAAKPKPMRSRLEIQMQIFSSIPPEQYYELLSAPLLPAFFLALDVAQLRGSYSNAVMILDLAKQKQQISQDHYNLIKNILI